jgi:hypothetical protein
MTLVERTNLLETVAAALEASADEAETLGDVRFVTQLHMPGLNDPCAVR